MLLVSSYKKVLTGFLFFISLFIISISCDSTEPPANISLTLKLEDVSCTETWLRLNSTNLQLPNNVTVFINDLQERTFNLTTADTLLYIDSLLPNQNYSFQIISFYNPEDGIKSNKVNATTMDTTSHSFTLEFYEFGEHSSPSLYDVAIIDENNIWAVGEIAFDDSLGNTTTYNAMHWDGQSWELKRIKTKACGGVEYPPIKAIFAFSINDVLFAHIDGSISRFNGIEFTNDCSLIIQLNGSAKKFGVYRKMTSMLLVLTGLLPTTKTETGQRLKVGQHFIYRIFGVQQIKHQERYKFYALRQINLIMKVKNY